jgi:hypothetical protein
MLLTEPIYMAASKYWMMIDGQQCAQFDKQQILEQARNQLSGTG